MPGRFPLVAVPLQNDYFCKAGVCFFDEGLAEAIAPCVAVIDETTPNLATQTADWNAFRAAWPNRPFYTLVPVGGGFSTSIDSVISPIGYDGQKVVVNRDNGNASIASDWFEICGFSSLNTGQPVFLFVDISGSMTLSTVAASDSLFRSRCAAAGLPISSVQNLQERYIQPFISALVPT